MSAFDPTTFMETETSDALATKLIPVPEGEYMAQISKIEGRKAVNKNQEEMALLDITWEVMDPDGKIKKVTGREKLTVRQTLFLEITAEGALASGEGKNIDLGKLREAVGQNRKGQKWKPSMLANQMATVTVKHTPNDKDPESPYANVVRVAKA